MVRTAIVGTGSSVGNHLTAVSALANRVELVAAVDVQEARVRAVCAEHHIPQWYTDVQAMLEAEHPDLVLVVTPPEAHKAVSIAALEAGAWVLCEKPLCASLADFDEVTQAEARTGGYVSTVFQWRFGSAAKHLKALMENGTFGRALVGVCETLWYRPQTYYDVAWRGKWATEFGGTTVTLGIHLMDLLLWLMGNWQEVRAMIGTLDRAIEVEDISTALVRFENGAMGTIINSVLSPRQESRLRLDFQAATLEVNALYRYANEHWRVSLPDNSPHQNLIAAWESLSENIPSSHAVQLNEVLDAREANQRPPVSGEDGRRILEFAASLYKASFTGQPVIRGEITPDDPFYHAMNGAPRVVEHP